MDLHFLSEMPWKFREEAKNERVFLSRFNDIVFIVAIKLELCVFESTRIDLGSVFEVELQVHS